MVLFELTNDESHPVYQELTISNGNRQYDLLISLVTASLKMQRPLLSATILKALNFQAIACLHVAAGEYRPCEVKVGQHYQPPGHFQVNALMEDFINIVNRTWEAADPVVLASFVLWRLNYIHPFINGNGRTARAACYFVLCVKAGGLLPGATILPELIKLNHAEYTAALREADKPTETGGPNLGPLHALLTRLISEQLATATSSIDPAAPPV